MRDFIGWYQEARRAGSNNSFLANGDDYAIKASWDNDKVYLKVTETSEDPLISGSVEISKAQIPAILAAFRSAYDIQMSDNVNPDMARQRVGDGNWPIQSIPSSRGTFSYYYSAPPEWRATMDVPNLWSGLSFVNSRISNPRLVWITDNGYYGTSIALGNFIWVGAEFDQLELILNQILAGRTEDIEI